MIDVKMQAIFGLSATESFWRVRNITANILHSYCDEEYKKLGLICSTLWEHFLRRHHRRKKHSRLQWWHCGRKISRCQANFSMSSLRILNCRENSYFCIFTQNCNNVVSQQNTFCVVVRGISKDFAVFRAILYL